jgi:hypothetical protein
MAPPQYAAGRCSASTSARAAGYAETRRPELERPSRLISDCPGGVRRFWSALERRAGAPLALTRSVCREIFVHGWALAGRSQMAWTKETWFMSTAHANDHGQVGDRVWLGVAVAALVAMVAVTAITLLTADVSSEVTAAVLAACVTGTVSVVIAVLGLLNRRQEKAERLHMRSQDLHERERIRCEDAEDRARIRHEDVVLRALEYFTGKTQRRNVGIAIVEFHWESTPRLRGVFVPLLVNQAVYLLEQSDQTTERHESDNLRRVVALLLGAMDSEGRAAERDYRALLDSLERRLKEPGATVTKGVSVDPKVLREWRDEVSRRLPHGPSTSQRPALESS